MEFRILGSVEAYDNGRTVDLGGLRERTLLARLVLSANHAVSADRLAEDLWSGKPPPHSMATLRVYISRLRRALGTAAEALITQPPGYRLNIGDDELDAVRFERLAASARADLAAGNPWAAAAGLRRALDLWRGRALSDVADLAFAQADVFRLEEARLTALEDRVAADLACGRHAEVIAELDGLVASQPLRERLRGQQILALYRCGRQADALDSYQRLRTRLAEELGIDPTPELRRLQESLLRQEPGLDWQPAAGELAGAGAGARPAAGVLGGRPDSEAHHAPPRRPSLPSETTSFIGREEELSEIEELLGLSRLLTLTGPSGSGKSRLALQSAVRLSGHYVDGTWLVQLASVARQELVLPVVASALQVREEPTMSQLDRITSRFADREVLIILDNCEHVLESAADVSAVLLRACPAMRILATSQSKLLVAGEASWPVPPLTVPPAGARDPQAVLRAESARLFCDRAALARPGFSVTAGNAGAVSEICRRLDGIPLAVELAAARISALTAAQLSARLDDRFRLLTGGSRTGLPRHRTLQAALDWSHDLLSYAEQVCFRRMAIFAGGCTIDAVEAVCPDDELPRQAIVETVSSLVDRSLLTTREQFGSMKAWPSGGR